MNVIISGVNGQMGKKLVQLIHTTQDIDIVAGIDKNICDMDFAQYTEFSDEIMADVIIDFSHFSAIPNLLDYIEKTKTPAVICTTGLSEELENRIVEISNTVPIFRSKNMSLGINLLVYLAKKGAEVLGKDFDIEILEMHHNKKVDSPSGTAFMIANELNKTLDNNMDFKYGRHGNSEKRKSNEIGIHSLRGGTVVGEHSVIFAGNDEIIKLEHSANSKTVFAKGAINAARFIITKKSGLYSMSDIL